MEHVQYGYFTPFQKNSVVKMKKGQNISGFPVGILYIEDVWYPMVPGNIVNGYTFDFPVRLKAVQNLNVDNLFRMEESVWQKVLEAGRELEKEGVRAVSAACGFFGNYQKELAKELNVPVAISSLVQIPWILPLLKPGQKIGILTADQASLTTRLLENCGVLDSERIVIKDLRHKKEFSCILEGRGEFDNHKAEGEVVDAAIELVRENQEIGAILLECSDMPPYAYKVQEAVKLPVFDFTTLIKWLHNAVTQRPYTGFI
ncbi:aspartate/glutamate racemase family protein [Anaeromicropila populeti]|uniref:Aspartate/glutamate racemase family protein n=1 Tax=Anaeromicropila populeti TaxID=37658 RepID=A0A1I6HLX2_9FIRM|nr:aspartate/glutamate racemase family protein [Anaeromicropila populeti]SFR55442.1 hypothetical protein SAMN05661086_00089 [Anaeromicropila populeti]